MGHSWVLSLALYVNTDKHYLILVTVGDKYKCFIKLTPVNVSAFEADGGEENAGVQRSNLVVLEKQDHQIKKFLDFFKL